MLPTKLGEFLQHLSQTISIHFARLIRKNVNDSHLFLFRLKNDEIINMRCSILKIKFNQNNNMNSFHWIQRELFYFRHLHRYQQPKKCIFIIWYLTYESEWRFLIEDKLAELQSSYGTDFNQWSPKCSALFIGSYLKSHIQRQFKHVHYLLRIYCN